MTISKLFNILFIALCGKFSRAQDMMTLKREISPPLLFNQSNDYIPTHLGSIIINETIIDQVPSTVPMTLINSSSTLQDTSSDTWKLLVNITTNLDPDTSKNYLKPVTKIRNVAKTVPDIRSSILNCINTIRSVEAQNAANMNMLAWDYTIEGYATHVAQHICTTGNVGKSPNTWPFRGAPGELIAISHKINSTNPAELMDKVCDLVLQWNNTSSSLPKNIDFSNLLYWDIGDSFDLAEPYLQLVLAHVTLVGCSFHTDCHSNIGSVVVCQFSDKPSASQPPYANIHKTLELTEPQRQPCGKCGFGAKCCAQNLCVGRDIGSMCPTCTFSEPLEPNHSDVSSCFDSYYQPCNQSNCPEACIGKHQIPDNLLVNQCLCTSKQTMEDMLLFQQLPEDPQILYTEGWLHKKFYYHGLCRPLTSSNPNLQSYPPVGGIQQVIPNDTQEEIEQTSGVTVAADSIRAALINSLNLARSSQPAADMAILAWDYTLEGYARLRAQQLCEEIDTNITLGSAQNYPPYVQWPFRGGSGETIFRYSESVTVPEDADEFESIQLQLGSLETEELVNLAVSTWVKEGETFDFYYPEKNIGKDFTNFIMVTRAEATAVGCGISTNCKYQNSKSVLVCQFNYPNIKQLIHQQESALRRKLLDMQNQFDLPFLHIYADPYLLLQQRRPCGRCRRGATCCENNLCVGVDISQSSLTFVPPMLENNPIGGCRSAFVRPCNKLKCEINCMSSSTSFLSHQCFCVSPENISKLGFASREALNLNQTLIHSLIGNNQTADSNQTLLQILDNMISYNQTLVGSNITFTNLLDDSMRLSLDSSDNSMRMLLADAISTPHPVATYGYIFGFIQSHGLCLTIPGYQTEYGESVITAIDNNITVINDRMSYSSELDDIPLLTGDFDEFIDSDNNSQIPQDITDNFRQEFLIALNSFRSVIGAYATDMNKLAYDFTMEGIAKSIARQCQLASLGNSFDIPGVPPLTYLSAANETLIPNNIASIVASWAKPLITSIESVESQNFKNTLLKSASSFTESARQLFSAHASGVGCSVITNCPENRYFVVCQFNYIDRSAIPFKPTEDGLNIPKQPCSCCGSLASCCENNLCVGGNSQAQDYSQCLKLKPSNLTNTTCSSSFFKPCKDLGCEGQCLKPLEQDDHFYDHYIFNQCTCSPKGAGLAPQSGLLQHGKALIRGSCVSVNTTSLNSPSILTTIDNLLDIPLISNSRNGNSKSQSLSNAIKDHLRNQLVILDGRPLLLALNEQRSKLGINSANMNILKWDYSIQGYAQNWAMVCLAGKNNNSPFEFPYRGGESEVVFASAPNETYNPFTSPIEVVQNWFSGKDSYEQFIEQTHKFIDIEDNKQINIKVNNNLGITPSILNYLTVAQASSTSVGCAVVEGCPNAGFIIVCQFDSAVNLNKPPFINIHNNTSLTELQAHPCGKCISGSTCCFNNMCVGFNQNSNKFSAPLLTKLSSNYQCLISISKNCNAGFCKKRCIPQITIEESMRIPLFNTSSFQFMINQCQCIPNNFIGSPIDAWTIGLVHRNGQCEHVLGFNSDIVKTQLDYIKTVVNKVKSLDYLPTLVDYPTNNSQYLVTNGILSESCKIAIKSSGLTLKCVIDPLNCGSSVSCYTFPNNPGCYCNTDPQSPQCKALTICRRDLVPNIKAIQANCVGKNVLNFGCPCSTNIFSIECGCYVDPLNPGCPCDKDSKSLVCQDLLRTSSVALKKVTHILSEATKTGRILRG
ncbi:uncharacterized protein CMU_014450 [Cryptosporidium muris RN66]|uniref:SCP domain-containing protein n=1 Tax=Cryptosporidium muris (strain RN66) TaxID=441375 RepID=B6AF02_CRYMR|nr:uncharacterized protein CMU_014450 [Cryptosporidium muris RN66]EEA06769.1 hypothetical protein, conserved [Cryptosporidium muris RN66]|eukprot:XP_002141118.1 hypothetical protein [Cryptosporidium muris RN66]